MNHLNAELIHHWAVRISESDREAFDNLFRSLYPPLVRFAIKYVRNEAAARDIVQDVFVMLWERRREIDPRRSLKAFMFTSVRNRALNFIRDHSAENIGLEPLDESKMSTVDMPGNLNAANPLADHLRKWIECLPARQREAFELSRYEGLDHDEIAMVMDVSPSTVNNHIVAALDNLRSQYDAYLKNQVNT
jgi:RNA polymerase sigma-70 factor (ECF subfamily)